MITIIKFENKYLKDATKLFINNYKILRKSNIELPQKYEDIDNVISMLSDVLKNNPSAVAIKDNNVVGYMTGFSNIQSFKGSAAGVYIPEWAHACIDTDEKEKIYLKLYSYLCNEWVNIKNYTHCITYFGNDSILKDLFHRLCFGLLVIDGLRPMESLNIGNIDNFKVRQAVKEDVLKIEELSKSLNKHLNDTPIFLNNKYKEKPIEELDKKFLSDNVITFVAEKDGEIVSCIRAMINEGPNSEIVQDEGTLGINFGYTIPDMRGSGIASKVLDELIKWGIDNDMKLCTVDFESQNVEAYNFWLRHFKPICYSAIRKLDDRI